MKISEKAIWSVSGLVSLLLLGFLFMLWVDKNQQAEDPTQLGTEAEVQAYLDEHWPNPALTIKTGIFIQSLAFRGATDVHMTGYIWQHYVDGVHDRIKPAEGELGVILPESVDESGGIMREAYRMRQGDSEVIGWYFERTVRQTFDYDDYPFDHKTVWLRLWPTEFMENIVLVPDLASYDETGPSDDFGIDNDIVLGTWQRENTFFDFKSTDYDTDFGVRDYIGQEHFPELYFNIVVRRNFENAFIVYMVPLLIVKTLLFGALMTITRKEGLIERHGANTSNVIATCSVLFFVVLLAHVQLREGFAGSPVVYLEYFYFMMYFLLLTVSINTYLFALDTTRSLWVIHYKDNLIPKAVFWPLVLTLMIAITLLA